jgi:hypothetical protein
MRHEYSRLNRGKHQLRCGVAVPHTTPQARRAQNGMPVELPGLAWSAKDRILSAELHGEALLAAQSPELEPIINHLARWAHGRDDIRVECAGTTRGLVVRRCRSTG